MLDSALSEAHSWLVSNGFSRVTEETRRYAYDGNLSCDQIEVPIRFSFYNMNFQELPEIHIRDPRPESLRRPLPHIDHYNKLCYLDEEKYQLDPYQPVQTIVSLLDQARKVLIDSIAGNNSDDVGYEFRSYWEWQIKGVMLSENQSGHITKYNRLEYQSPIGNTHKQLVIGSDEDINRYREWHQGRMVFTENLNAIWINVNTTALLPESGPWPPENFKDLHEWLDVIDPKSAKTLRYTLGTKAGAQSPLLIVLNTKGGIVAAEVKLPKSLSCVANDPGRFRKQLLIDQGKFGTTFIRSIIDDITPRHLTTRNLPGSSLSGKRIILIGCGTIGGYLSRLLVQSGAGKDSGELILYDGEDLSTGNIGRHYLDTSYLYENKAEACKHKLLSEYPNTGIHAIPKNFIDINDVRTVDIIIDATGREPFSLSLNSKLISKRKKRTPCPDALYVWIDGNGYCGRTLFYDGTGGCYRCLQDLSGRAKFKSAREEDLVPISYRCGESFIPYPPSVSVQAAGMGLETILDWVNGNAEPHFRHRSFHKKAYQHKNKHLKTVVGCPACQK